MEHLIAEFLASLASDRGLASATISAYRTDLLRYSEHLDGAPPDEAAISAFLAAMHAAGLSRATMARRIAAVRQFHRFVVSEELDDTDPTARIETPRRSRSLPKALTVEDTFRILEAPDQSRVGGRRDRALLEFMYSTAARVSETVGLDEHDLDLEEGTAVLTGKGDRQRMVPVGGPAREAVRTWLADRQSLRSGHTGAVFLSLRGRRLTRQTVWTVVRKNAARAGVTPESVSPHVLRHSAATHMVEGGADLRTVQEILGHASISTTQIYTRVSPRHLLEVHATTHPRS